jgi:aminoglycoside 6'-N-acetyltransferase
MANGNLSINFSPLSSEHFSLLEGWPNQPHVQKFYSLRSWALKDIADKFTPYINKQKPVEAFIASMDGSSLGYIQKYAVQDFPWPDQELSSQIIASAAGLDFLIGARELCGKGLGTKLVTTFLKHFICPQ